MESLWKIFSRPEFLGSFRVLSRLRYKLIWAQVRTDNGKVALFFALYLLIGFLAIFMALGGIGGALAAIELGQGEVVARLMLTGLMFNGVGLSLLFGLGSREAFSEASLRRYPLRAEERFAIRHFIGLLDPIWILLISAVFGLVGGFVWFGAGSVWTGGVAALLFIVADYLLTVTLLTAVGRMLESRRGATMLGAMMILLLSFAPLTLGSLPPPTRKVIREVLSACLEVMPPGAAASMIAGEDLSRIAGGAGLLILWSALMVFILRSIERRPRTVDSGRPGAIVWDDLYDQAARIFGAAYWPMVSRSLRYHLRCNIIRFSLISSPLVILMFRYLLPARGENSYLSMSIAVFFIMSSANGAAMMLNLFGYDGPGMRRFAVLPVRLGDALRAASLASLLLRAITFLAGFTLWVVIYSDRSITWQSIVVVLTVSLAGIVMFNGLGLWVSIYSPKKGDFEAMWNNRLSIGANIVVIGGAVFPFWFLMTVMERISRQTLNRLWWVPPVYLVLCLAFYALSLRFIDMPLRGRREKLLGLIAGGGDS